MLDKIVIQTKMQAIRRNNIKFSESMLLNILHVNNKKFHRYNHSRGNLFTM